MPIVIGAGRDTELGITEQGMEKRTDKIDEALLPHITKMAMFLAEGHTMTYGTRFASGGDLAMYLTGAIRFAVAALMEQGHLPKTLPKKSKKKEDETGTGHYL
jgi:hypothetical protein